MNTSYNECEVDIFVYRNIIFVDCCRVDVLFMDSITSLDARDFIFADDSCKFYAKTKVIYG